MSKIRRATIFIRLVFIGVMLAFVTASLVGKLPSNIGYLMREIPQWFSRSEFRLEAFNDLFKVMNSSYDQAAANNKAVPLTLLKPSATRWLVRGKDPTVQVFSQLQSQVYERRLNELNSKFEMIKSNTSRLVAGLEMMSSKFEMLQNNTLRLVAGLEQMNEILQRNSTGLATEVQQVNSKVSILQGNISELATGLETADVKFEMLQSNTSVLVAGLEKVNSKFKLIQSNVSVLATASQSLGLVTNPAASCQEIKSKNASTSNGLYYIKDSESNVFQTYCDMTTSGGGWTLVASVHENNMRGRCTSGDRWSSEQGNSANHPHGDGFWENRATHGMASSSTSDDYKNSGYFALNASDIMIWHVPNDTPLKRFEERAFFKYHTTNGILMQYGGNLGSLYSQYFNMRSKQFKANTDNGPAAPIIWDRGNNEEMKRLLSNVKNYLDVGYIQFRVLNNERNAFALCPGFKVKPGFVHVEHACIGSTSYNIGSFHEEEYCGDYAAIDWRHVSGWSASTQLITAVTMIFYK